MLTRMSHRGTRRKTEGEKPFWISYADLMSGMMMLFLVTMATMIMVITRKVAQVEAKEVIRNRQIAQICHQLQNTLTGDDVIHVDCHNQRIDFGDMGRFAFDSYQLPKAIEPALARLIPVVLKAADTPLGRQWLKQVVIEGFTDTRGAYLYNLDLSLKRSEWVMCLLLDPKLNTHLALTPAQLQRVRSLFLAGGVSFNEAKSTHQASRRVELQLHFYGLNEKDGFNRPVFQGPAHDRCPLS